MVKRLMSYVGDMALDDFFQGTAVSLPGDAGGFEVGALIRINRTSDESQAALEGQLIWGAGSFTAATVNGWALWMRQTSNTGWEFRWDIATLGGSTAGVNRSWSGLDMPGDDHTIFLHALWSPDITVLGQGAGAGVALYMNGFFVAAANKTSYRAALTPPAIGAGVLAGAVTDPRFEVAATAYREGLPVYDTHFADVYKAVCTADDLQQLPAGQFQWDNIFSVRRGLRDVDEAGELWTDAIGGVQLQRTGAGNSMATGAAKPHHWSL